MKVESFVCPFCGNLCDDLILDLGGEKCDVSLKISGGSIVGVENACRLGERKIRGEGRIDAPLIDGRRVSYEEAYERAAEILSESKRPLFYGFSSTSCEAYRAAIQLAVKIGGVVDNTTSVCHGPSVLATQEVGLPSCTLGEVKHRADLVIYWGANPINAHPRHLRRYSYAARGKFVEGKKGRRLIVVDVRMTPTAKLADEVFIVPPGEDYKLISALRACIKGHGSHLPSSVAGIERERIERFADMMRSAKFGILFFGVGLTHSRGGVANVSNAICMVRELNRFTKFAIMPMRGHYNVTGCNQVSCWLTGFPYGVDLCGKEPWYNPGETTAVDILCREECDSALIVASDPVAHFPSRAVEHLKKIPVIDIDPFPSLTSRIAKVVIPSAISGVESEGTAYRMDGVPIRLRKIIDRGFPSDEEIIEEISSRVKWNLR